MEKYNNVKKLVRGDWIITIMKNHDKWEVWEEVEDRIVLQAKFDSYNEALEYAENLT